MYLVLPDANKDATAHVREQIVESVQRARAGQLAVQR